MENYLTLNVNGKTVKIPVALTEEQVKNFCEAVEIIEEENSEKTGWEYPENGDIFYYEDALCRIQSVRVNDSSRAQLDLLYEKGNCYSNEEIANELARANALTRVLRRFAITNRKKPLDYSDMGGYTITYNYQNNCLECGVTGHWMAFGDIVFDTEETAREAMNFYAEDLIWYFTKLHDKL